MEDPNPDSESVPEATPSTSQQPQEAGTGSRIWLQFPELPENYAAYYVPLSPLSECFNRIAHELAVTIAKTRLDMAFAGSTARYSGLSQLPEARLIECFKRVANLLKLTIVEQTYGVSGEVEVKNYNLYCGLLGTAFLLFKSYQVTGNADDLTLCSKIVKACDAASLHSRHVTFLLGRAGVCALGAAAAKYRGDDRTMEYYVVQFQKIEVPKHSPDNLRIGRIGYIWACLFLNKHLGQETVPYHYTALFVDEVIKNGRAMGRKGGCPLMFKVHGLKFWGAMHGLAGIMHVLMDMKLKPDELEDVKGTLKYMIRNRLPNGNYPLSDEDRDGRFMTWCDGAPGIAITLVKAAKVFGDKEFLDAAIQVGNMVWEARLFQRVGICHGMSGYAYVFLSLYRHTGNVEYLGRAKAFTCYALNQAPKQIPRGEMHGGDYPYSLFEGIGGLAYLLLDMVDPTQSKLPAYEL